MNPYKLLALWLLLPTLFSCGRGCKPVSDKDLTITVDVADPIEFLDPRYATSATAARVAKLIYASLFEMGNDASPHPFLAQSFESLENNTFRIVLRKNLQFHDGSPLTAHDVVYTYTQLKSDDVASPHGEKFDYIKKIYATSDTDVIFELAQPHAPFLTDLCAIGIVSKKACEGRSQKCRHENIGSGPYKVKQFDQIKETVELAPFAEWFEGQPKNSLVFRVVRDENTRILELIGRKADLVDGEFSATNSAELKKQNHLSVQEIPGFGFTYLAFNVRGPRPDDKKDSPQYLTRLAIADKSVRRAIAHAIDFDQIIEKVFLRSAVRASGLIPNGHWAKDTALKPPPFDPLLAEKIMDDAGFRRKGPDNIRFKLVMTCTPNRLRQSTAQLFVDYLKRVGIDASIRVKEWGALYEDIKQGQFELFSAVWVPVTDPDLYYFVHHSSSIPNEHHVGGNRHGYVNHDVDKLIELGRVKLDQKERTPIYQEIERIMLTDMPYIPAWNENRITVINQEKVKGYEQSRTGSFIGLRKAYLAEKNMPKDSR